MRIKINGINYEKGEIYERVIFERYYSLKAYESDFIEPGIKFYGNIAPSTVDFIAEFDLIISKANGIKELYELKNKHQINEYDILKFYIQTKRVGLNKSRLFFYANGGMDQKLRNKAKEEFGIIANNKKMRSFFKSSKLKPAIEEMLLRGDTRIYLEYHEIASKMFPGYYFLLNNYWIPQYKFKEEVINQIQVVFTEGIKNTKNIERKVMEFILLKSEILRRWFTPSERYRLSTTDFIGLIKYNKDEKVKLNAQQKDLKEWFNNKINLSHFELSIDDKVSIHYKKGREYEIIRYPNNIYQLKNLYVLIGNDHYILKDLAEIIIRLYRNHKNPQIFLIHTHSEPSKLMANDLYNWLTKIERIKENTKPPISLEEVTNFKDQGIKLIKFLKSKASLDSALLITYVPKLWALTLFEFRKNWKHFFIIDRPESIVSNKDNRKEMTELLAFDLRDK